MARRGSKQTGKFDVKDEIAKNHYKNEYKY